MDSKLHEETKQFLKEDTEKFVIEGNFQKKLHKHLSLFLKNVVDTRVISLSKELVTQYLKEF
jgi:hypothetical protein